ncbi:MAG: hypothetical protein ACRDQZ_09365 [Mycobacteriales bacterium]
MRLVAVPAWLCVLVVSGTGCAFGSSQPNDATADPSTVINVDGVIGGIHALEKRTEVEHVLGTGAVLSTVIRHPKTGTVTIQRVHYATSRLTVVYDQGGGQPQMVYAVFTNSPRYHTSSGLRVGSTLAQARRTPGIHCYYQVKYFACQGGVGYEKPIVSFTVRSGKVVRVFMAAVAD